MKKNTVHVEKGMHGFWVTVLMGSCNLRLGDLSMHGLSLMNFSLSVYEDGQLGCLKMISNYAWVVPMTLKWWESGIESVVQYQPSLNSQNKTLWWKSSTLDDAAKQKQQGREEANHPSGTVGRASIEVSRRRLLRRLLRPPVAPFCCFFSHHIFRHVRCNGRNVLPLQNSPTPLHRVDLSLSFFFWSLWPRGKSQNGHFWPRRDRNTATPIHHSGTNPAGAQTLQPIIQLCCCRARVGTGFIATLTLCFVGGAHIWSTTAPFACWVWCSLWPTPMNWLVHLMGCW